MIGKLRRAGRHGRHALAAFCALIVGLGSGRAAAQSPPYVNQGLRWIGTSTTCTAPTGWTAERVFHSAQWPAALTQLCLFTWNASGAPPTAAQVGKLFSASAASELTEDAPVIAPSGAAADEQALLTALRTSLRAQVGDASLLPAMPATPAVRVVVIDSAPDATAGHIQIGASRHGDTLAHLIEDLVCRTDGGVSRCAAEVTSELALPWIARGVVGPHGGYTGTLTDVARAIERAITTWQSDQLAAPATTPAHLLLNLSIGWEDTAHIADCSTVPLASLGPPARAVRGILQQAATLGALLVAAAGNDSGGPSPRTGLLCPGRYQAVAQDRDATQSLVIAVSGLDYQDHPLETVRPLGVTGIAGLGLGGVAWNPSDPPPPMLIGSSVSTAVVSAISALVWAYQPSATIGQISHALYDDGVDVGTANECPLAISQCRSHRASVCAALRAIGASPSCTVPAAQTASCPALPAQVAALAADYAAVAPVAAAPVAVASAPRFLAPSVQVSPSVFPQPISGTCPTCWAAAMAGPAPTFVLPTLGQDLTDAVLVVRLADGSLHALSLGTLSAGTPSYTFVLQAGWIVKSAYLTGYDVNLYSVTEQIFIQP